MALKATGRNTGPATGAGPVAGGWDGAGVVSTDFGGVVLQAETSAVMTMEDASKLERLDNIGSQ
jgi:hypothetical protein